MKIVNEKNMVKYRALFALMTAVMLLSSCMKEMPDSWSGYTVSKGVKDSGTDPAPESKDLKVSVESLSFVAAEGSESFMITSNTSWTIESDQSWCTVSSSSGSGNSTITVSVQENTSIDLRTAMITVKAGDLTQTISVTQAGANATLQIDKSSMTFDASGGNDNFTITSNTSWTIESDQSWCTVSSSSGSGNSTITVSVQENTSIDLWTAMITVKAGDLTQTISVTQAGANATLQIDKSSLSFDSSGGSDSFSITSNASWTITSDQSWCTLSSTSGSGNSTITVSVQENTSLDLRTAMITVKAGDLTQTISVTQAGATLPEDQGTRTFTVNGVSFKMIRVDGGTFTMGATSEQGSDAESDEKPTHSVTLSTYYIGETEVTQELWQAVMGSNPSRFSGSRKPVEQVSWDDCQDFVTKLSSLTGENFRLPTEAEWEFAARGGNNSRGYKYSGSNTIGDVVWYWDNIPSQTSGATGYGTQNVATKKPNELGLYDMSGNVWEWCQDWYGNYSSSSQTYPTGPSSGSYRVSRGGSWDNKARISRVSNRESYSPVLRLNILGLRLAL